MAELSDRSEGVRDADAEPAVPGARRPLPVGRPPPHTRAHACTHARRAPTHMCAHALKLAIRPAVPQLTIVHTRKCSPCPDSHACTHSHTHWAPTRTCAHARAHAGPCPGCVQTPGALCAWLRQSVVSCPHPASRIPAKDLRHVALAHPAPRLLPAWGGTAAPLRPLRPAPRAGSAGAASRSLLTGPRAPDFRSRFPPSVRGSRGSSGWVSVACGSSRADVLLLVLTTPNVLRRLRPMVSVTAVWRIRGRF